MNKFSPLMKPTLAVAALLLTSASALALTDGPYSASFPASGTQNFPLNSTLTLPKFNVSGGTLTSVSITLFGSMTATQRGENLDSAPATLQITTQGTITLKRPDNSTLVITQPQLINSANLAAFDGNADFAGVSGITFTPVVTTKSDTSAFTSSTDLALFTGAGTIALPVVGSGISFGEGPSNLTVNAGLVGFTTASVTYTYSTAAPVPEASTYGSIGAVTVAGFLGYRRARRKAVQTA